jgi:hypothetical protein
MDATCYRVLIEVHLRESIFLKGQILTLDELGPYAFTLIRYALVRGEAVAVCPASPASAPQAA